MKQGQNLTTLKPGLGKGVFNPTLLPMLLYSNPCQKKSLFVMRFGFSEPDRGDLENEDIEWRHGKPDYTMANYQFLR